MRRLLFRFSLLVLLALSESSHCAASDADQSAAQSHFLRAFQLIDENDLTAAVAEFKKAYAASPHYTVLFNLAQAQSTLGRAVEAVESYERYLREGGAEISKKRRALVVELIKRQSARIAYVELSGFPEGTEFSLDGSSVASPPSSKIAVNAGPHALIARTNGRDRTATFDVAPGQTFRFVFDAGVPDPRLALVARDTHADVAPVLAELVINVPQAHARVTIDGVPRSRARLAAGQHSITVEAPNHVSWRGQVVTEAGKLRQLGIDLQPALQFSERQRAARRDRVLALSLGISGLALAGAATGTFIWNSRRYDQWQGDRDRVDEKLRQGAVDPATLAENDRVRARGADIGRVDAATFALGTLSIAALGASVYFLLDGMRLEPHGAASTPH